jgi:hypothetical protein
LGSHHKINEEINNEDDEGSMNNNPNEIDDDSSLDYSESVNFANKLNYRHSTPAENIQAL